MERCALFAFLFTNQKELLGTSAVSADKSFEKIDN